MLTFWGPWQLRVILVAAMAVGLFSAVWLARREQGRAGAGAIPARLDLNRATAAELEALPGMTPRQAAQIVHHRRSKGAFTRLEDLAAVSGVGAEEIELWAPYVRAGPEDRTPVIGDQ